MEHINNLLGKAQQPSTSTQQTGELDVETKLLFNKIFKELVVIYPAWKQAFSDQEAIDNSKRLWAKQIKRHNINQWEIIEDALSACVDAGGAFIPEVGVFIGYCRDAALKRSGGLETMKAYKQLQGHYAKPIEHREPCDLNRLVYHTISQVDFDVMGFKVMRTKDAVEYFSDHYQETLKHALAGGEIKEPIKRAHRIENPSGITPLKQNQEAGNAALDGLKDLLKD